MLMEAFLLGLLWYVRCNHNTSVNRLGKILLFGLLYETVCNLLGFRLTGDEVTYRPSWKVKSFA